MPAYDVIVAGIGGMGSATAWHLARAGARVLGLERFDIPHGLGSSHGLTRIIRLAYHESPLYVPLLRRAYENWHAAERAYGEQLLFTTGSIDAGPSDSFVVRGALAACAEHDLPHEALSGAQANRRFPGYALPDAYVAVFQPDGGFIASERAIVAHAALAQAAGAEIRTRERVRAWERAGDGVRVRTDRGTYEAGRLVLTAGAWLGRLAPRLASVAVPERQVLGWFEPPRDPSAFAPELFPVINLLDDGGVHWYALPSWGMPGLKVGRYRHLNEPIDPDVDPRDVTSNDEAVLRDIVRRCFPGADGPITGLSTCMFTNTPDGHFILDTLPGEDRVIVASPCSGHGYKFCSVIGEIIADLASRGHSRFDLHPFRLSRFA